MSDSQAAAGAAVTDPAEVPKTESVESKVEAKVEAPGENATIDATDNATTADHEKAANGSAEAVKTEESSAEKKEEKATNGEREREGRDDRDRPNGHERGGRGSHRSRGGRGNRGGRGGRNHDDQKRRNTEFDDLPETDDPVEIRSQVEFYFSANNLSTDKHLFFELQGPKNRPVSIKHLSQFKRMRRFQPYSAIVDALRESEDLVVVDDGEFNGTGREAVKRKEALVVPTEDDDDERPPSTEELYERVLKSSINKLENCIYAKGFAAEGEDVGQITLEQFFKPYGAVMIRKRRDDSGNPKGSIFVEFDNEESQQQFLALDPMPKFNGNELTVMSKKAYSEMKCKEKGITPAWLRNDEYKGARGRQDRRGRGDTRGRGGRGRGQRGGSRGGRYNDRDRRDGGRRDRSRDRRDRSGSRSSNDSRDWNGRRDRFQKSKDYKKKDDKRDDEHRKSVEKDAHGVPVLQDTRTAEEKSESRKRKADGDDNSSPKKSKLQIKEDE